MQITDYIKPELLAVALVLYFVGIGLKHSQTIPCEKEEWIRHEGKRKDYVKRCILQRRCAKIVRGCLIRSSSHNIISAQVHRDFRLFVVTSF